MQTAPPPTRDVALESRVFWLRFRKEIIAVILVALLVIIGFAGFRFYSDQQEESAASLLARAKGDAEFQQVITQYPSTSAAASAYLLLADQQRAEKKFTEANATLQTFVGKYPDHELAPTARVAMAGNLESMGKTDEALGVYQQVATGYPTNFNAPLALISRVHILKAKNRNDEARQACDTIINMYPESAWAREARQELFFMKPNTPPSIPGAATEPQNKAGVAPSLLARPPMPAPAAAPSAKP